MINRYTRLRVRRQVRNRKKSIEKVGEQVSEEFEAQVLDRWRNLKHVQRFVVGWLLLVSLLVLGVILQNRQLSAYHRTQLPVAGGTFREGVVGDITNINPIFAASQADRAASKLLFNSLFVYDGQGRIVGDLADTYTTNQDGTIYTVKLREDVFWHDGEQFDAEDVVFTYEAIQHPDARSYLNAAWRDVKVQLKDQFEVTFALPNPFAPFVHSLTQGGVIPKHILGDLNPAQLRGHEFNTASPVGTGPFVFRELLGEASQTTVDERQLRLDKYEQYHGGAVQLDHFVLATFSDREEMINRFLNGELAAIAGVQTNDQELLVDTPEAVWHDLALNNAVFVFLKTDDGPLKSKAVRQALTHAINPLEIQKATKGRYAVLDSPVLQETLAYDPSITQKEFNLDAANELLTQAGWHYKTGDLNDGYRYKDEVRLSFEFITQNSEDYPIVAQSIQDQWAAVGVLVNPRAVEETDIQQNHISPHNYSALLFGIELGADPDPFVYWHSSQSGVNGFNLSELEDAVIDEALESGRTRLDDDLRAVKYQAFLNQWVEAAPAISLYRPAYGYVQRRSVWGFEATPLNSSEHRFYSVHQWQINTKEGSKPY